MPNHLDANGYTQHNNGDGIEQRTHNGTHQYRFYTDDAAGPWRPTRGEAQDDADRHRRTA